MGKEDYEQYLTQCLGGHQMTKPENKQNITEESGVHLAWYEEARKITVDTLPAFLEKLTTTYEHDYGTICHAVAASAIAGATAINKSPCGGITGFQASAVMWEFISHWLHKEGQPLRLLDYGDMLFPQYREKFCTISGDTWEWLQKEAAQRQEGAIETKASVHPEVKAHWQSIINGHVPFGFIVEEQD